MAGAAPAPVTPTTKPFSHPFSRRSASHSRSSSPTRVSISFARFSSACSRSFFFARKRADAAVFLRRLSSAAVSDVPGGNSSSSSSSPSLSFSFSWLLALPPSTGEKGADAVDALRVRARLAAGGDGAEDAEDAALSGGADSAGGGIGGGAANCPLCACCE
jgi:hypothetical protein